LQFGSGALKKEKSLSIVQYFWTIEGGVKRVGSVHDP
jgi:hypothetical protein